MDDPRTVTHGVKNEREILHWAAVASHATLFRREYEFLYTPEEYFFPRTEFLSRDFRTYRTSRPTEMQS